MSKPDCRHYPSDLTEQQWSRLESLLPETSKTGRRRTISFRDVANAINYRWETGCAWRMLPHDFPHWATVYFYFREWQRTGVIREFRSVMLERQPKPPRKFYANPNEGFSSPNAHSQRTCGTQSATEADPVSMDPQDLQRCVQLP